jgi:hypothetical protein
LDAELHLESAGTGNEADDGLRKVDVEIVADNSAGLEERRVERTWQNAEGLSPEAA